MQMMPASNSAIIARTLNGSLPWGGGVMDGTANAEFHFEAGKVAGNFVGVPEGPGKTITKGNDKSISGPACGEVFAQSYAILVPPGKAIINRGAFGFNAEGCQGITLGVEA